MGETLDCKGLFCPEPVFRTKVAVERAQSGDTVTVVADDPAAEDDITRWASRSGHEVVSSGRDGAVVTVVIRKSK